MRLADKGFQFLTHATALAVLGLLGGIIIALMIGAMPALRAFGLGFLTTQKWNPVTQQFGALAPIYGTIVTSTIAMAIAVPIRLLVAMIVPALSPTGLRLSMALAVL